MLKHKVTVTNGQQIIVIKHLAEETGRNWYTLDKLGNSLPFVVDDTGRIGFEQYNQLGVTADGEYFIANK